MNAQIPAPAPSPRAPAPAPIPVVCDRCRAEGLSGADPFAAFGALLDFDPVPRRKTRPDGWDHECQRAFIAALSLTGSVRAACRAVGKSAFGAERLREAEGGESFAAAWEEAEAIAGDERSRRLAEGVELDDGVTAPAQASQPNPGVLRITIHEGRNRQVRRMCEAVGHPVRALTRTKIGPLADRRLRPGDWRELTEAEVRMLTGLASRPAPAPPPAPRPRAPRAGARPRGGPAR